MELPSPACTAHAAVLLGVQSPWPPSGSLQAENKEEEKTDSKFKVKRLKILSPDVTETSSSRVSALNPGGPPSPAKLCRAPVWAAGGGEPWLEQASIFQSNPECT